MVIWLASFPRSGNTFARNVLYDSYGLVSTEVNLESLDYSSTHEEYPVVKTHLRPGQVPLRSKDHVVVYLVRDGRDALVSIAHHRTNIISPGSDFLKNLEEAIRAEEGSYFGGWGLNVAEWLERTDVVIRFEDLIRNPIEQLERIRDFIELPEPKKEALPTFSSQKFGNPKYGPQKGENQLFFRKGRSNGWKEEMPAHLEEIFWKKHGQVMLALGYQRTGECTSLPDAERIRFHARKLIIDQTGLWMRMKRSIFGLFRNPQAVSPPKWRIQPELIVLDTGIDPDQHFIQVLKRQYAFEDIGVFRYPGKETGRLTDLNGSPLSHPENCKVILTDCSRPEFLTRVQLHKSPKWMAWIRDPFQVIAEAWERSGNHADVHSRYLNTECPADLRQEIEEFIQTYDQRNRMHRVVSPLSSYLDIVCDLDTFSQDLRIIADQMGWTDMSASNFPDHVRSPLARMEWFCEQVKIYNKKDVELYEVWKTSRNVNS